MSSIIGFIVDVVLFYFLFLTFFIRFVPIQKSIIVSISMLFIMSSSLSTQLHDLPLTRLNNVPLTQLHDLPSTQLYKKNVQIIKYIQKVEIHERQLNSKNQSEIQLLVRHYSVILCQISRCVYEEISMGDQYDMIMKSFIDLLCLKKTIEMMRRDTTFIDDLCSLCDLVFDTKVKKDMNKKLLQSV